MVAKMGQAARMTREMAREAVAAQVEAGSLRAGAATLGLSRHAFQKRIDAAVAMGLTKPRTEANPSRWRPGDEIVAARKAEFQRVRASGPKASGNVIHRPDDGPFMVVPLGDLHLDSPGSDLELFERWIAVGDRAKHRTFILLGDVLDNWVKPLAHLYSNAETAAPDGWTLLQHYLEQFGPNLDFSVGGNHDAWSGHSDVLAMLMEEYGVIHRAHSIRVTYRTRGGRELTINARHSWPGRSMWNEVHGLKRAARMGVRDTILLGGHTHVSGEALEKDPMSGKLTFCFQVASFKTEDDYADQLGFLDRHVSPAVCLVIDPRRADDDPGLVSAFHDPQQGADYLAFLRKRAA